MKNKKNLQNTFRPLPDNGCGIWLYDPCFRTGGSEQAPAAPAEDSTNDSNVIVEETEPAPALTPDGNAALVDDFGGNKQLITVTTKAGNLFLHFDRQG